MDLLGVGTDARLRHEGHPANRTFAGSKLSVRDSAIYEFSFCHADSFPQAEGDCYSVDIQTAPLPIRSAPRSALAQRVCFASAKEDGGIVDPIQRNGGNHETQFR